MKETMIYPVERWGGVRVDNSRLALSAPVGVMIHHTAGPNRPAVRGQDAAERMAFALAKSIQRFHMRKTPPWRDSGHHFFVSVEGLILEGRRGTLAAADKGLVLAGAHSGDNAANRTRWGIETEGTFTDQLPAPAQWEALVWLCAWLSVQGNTQAREILGHRERRATQCPGDALFAALPSLQAEARAVKLRMLAK